MKDLWQVKTNRPPANAARFTCASAASIERHNGFDIAAKIKRQAPGFTEEVVELPLEDGGFAPPLLTYKQPVSLLESCRAS